MEKGQGVPQDFKDACQMYEASAKGGCAQGHFNLADMYDLGKGYAKDHAKALHHFTKSAELGLVSGQLMLANIYRYGRYGVQPDEKLALQWFLAAADRGDANAQQNVGISYALGLGITKNPEEACYWFTKAQASGLDLKVWRQKLDARATEIDQYEASKIQEHIKKYNELQSEVNDPATEVIAGPTGRWEMSPHSVNARRDRAYIALQAELARTRPQRQSEYAILADVVEVLDKILDE
jgi:hypothetical protein